MKYFGIILQAKHKPQSKDDLHMWSVKRENGDGLTPLVDQGEEDYLAKQNMLLAFAGGIRGKRTCAAKVCYVIINIYNPSTLLLFNIYLVVNFRTCNTLYERASR